MSTIHWAVLFGGDAFLAVAAFTSGWQFGRRAGLARREPAEEVRS